MKDKIKMNLIQQDVYAVFSDDLYIDDRDFLQKEYVSQDEIVEDSGIKIKRTVQEYPITPESVNSYADGTNYRNDLSAAANRPSPGHNVGDVAALQELFSRSPEEIKAFMESAIEKIKASKAKPVDEKSVVDKEVANG